MELQFGGYEPNAIADWRMVPAMNDMLTCKVCCQNGENDVWCESCARLTHRHCSEVVNGFIVCRDCITEWEAQHMMAIASM